MDDPLKEISQCQALIAPITKGAGVKVKVVDAMTTGTSVIGTNVAFEGIEDNSELELMMLANSSPEFSRIINDWIDDTGKRKEAAAMEFFVRYDKNHIVEKIDNLIMQN